MNYRKILKFTLIVLAVAFIVMLFIDLFHLDSGKEFRVSTIVIWEGCIIPILLFSSLYLDRHWYFIYRRAIKNKITKNEFQNFERYLGKNVIITTNVNDIHGTLVEVEGNWIKVKDHDMRPMVHILKSTMIIAIKVKRGE